MLARLSHHRFVVKASQEGSMKYLKLTFALFVFFSLDLSAAESTKTVDTGNGDVKFWTYEK